MSDDDDNHGEVASPQQSKRGFLKRLRVFEDTGSESGDVPGSPSTSIPPTPLPISSGTPLTPGTPATPMTSEKLVPQPATLETGLGPAKQRRTAGPPSHAQPAASAASAGGDPPRFGAEASAKAAVKVGVEWWARRLHQALSASGVIQRLQNQKWSTPLLLE